MPTSDSLHLLDQRYRQQAQWSAGVRRYFFESTGCKPKRMLDVGCGTGALYPELAQHSAAVHGIDHTIDVLRMHPGRDLVQADAHRLPYPAGSFDLAVTHFVFLWLTHPKQCLAELGRVVAPGGWIAAFAEPDHAARIDYPPTLAEYGRLQTQALARQGAHVSMGRELAGLFHTAGLIHVTSGVIGAEWTTGTPVETTGAQLEEQIWQNDLQPFVSEATIHSLQQHDRQARSSGERVLFVPTFFAWGQIPA